jgi:DNA repair protein RadC
MVKHNISEIELIYKPNKYLNTSISSSNEAVSIFREFWNPSTIGYYEEFKIMYLDKANHVLGVYNHGKGGLNGVVVDVRMIFQAALIANSHSIIVAHNHPSENLNPSQPDKDLTKEIKEAGILLKIPLLDHLIITKDNYLSFAEKGYL